MNEEVAAAGEGGSNVTAGVDKAENAGKHKCGEGCKCIDRRPKAITESEQPAAQAPAPTAAEVRSNALRAAVLARASSLLGALKK